MTTHPSHGYMDCVCSTCFDTAVCSAPAGTQHDTFSEYHLCAECEEAGCDASGNEECHRDRESEEEVNEDEQYECLECGTPHGGPGCTPQ